jgi:restriction system protein
MAAKKLMTDPTATVRRPRGKIAAADGTCRVEELRRQGTVVESHSAGDSPNSNELRAGRALHPVPDDDDARTAHDHHVRRLKTEAAQRTADTANRVAMLTHVLHDRERAVHHHRLTLARTFATLGPEGLTRLVATVLADVSRYPAAVADPVRAGYELRTRELRLRVELPRLSAVPTDSGHRYLPSRGEVVADRRKPEEIRTLYRELTARFVLRTLDYAFAVTPPDLVETIVLDGRLRAADPATGRPAHPCLVSLRVRRDVFEDVDLDHADPVAALTSLRALLSPRPYDLEPVRSLLSIDPGQVPSQREPALPVRPGDRADLLGLAPADFACLIRALLTAMGHRAWVARSAPEHGVDAVTIGPDPCVGLCVVRARPTARVVPVAEVRALLGAVADLDAGQGILLTTAWFSTADRACATRSGRLRLVDGSTLRRLLSEYLGVEAVVGLPRLPAGWHPADIG